MARLAQLLAHHRRILVLDAASTTVAVGLLRADGPSVWGSEAGDATRGVFKQTAAVLAQGQITLSEIDAFVFSEGPGSMLGIRTVAMALRSWQTLAKRPIYAYQSLALAAQAEWLRQARGFAVIADARRDTWHVQAISGDGRLEALRRVATASLPAGELLTPENFRAWSACPSHVITCAYQPAELLARAGEADLFIAQENPDAFQHESPEYQKWSAQLHSADTAGRE